jgi:hypothetical protein
LLGLLNQISSIFFFNTAAGIAGFEFEIEFVLLTNGVKPIQPDDRHHPQ